LFFIEEYYLSNMNHHPVCAFGAVTPPGQAVLSKLASLNAEAWRKYWEYSSEFAS